MVRYDVKMTNMIKNYHNNLFNFQKIRGNSDTKISNFCIIIIRLLYKARWPYFLLHGSNQAGEHPVHECMTIFRDTSEITTDASQFHIEKLKIFILILELGFFNTVTLAIKMIIIFC